MGRRPCCAGQGLKRGTWSAEEDDILVRYIQTHGEGKWRDLPQKAGLKRCGKSCRLRWVNYLRPDIKKGNISSEEEDLILKLHKVLGNRWSLIAGRLPGRTDNEIKNYWNTKLRKRIVMKSSTHKRKQRSDSGNTRTASHQVIRSWLSHDHDDHDQHQMVATNSVPDSVSSQASSSGSNLQGENQQHHQNSSDSVLDFDVGELLDFTDLGEPNFRDLGEPNFRDLGEPNFSSGGIWREPIDDVLQPCVQDLDFNAPDNLFLKTEYDDDYGSLFS